MTMVFVENFQPGDFLDVAGGDRAFFIDRNVQAAGFVIGSLELDLLEGQDDVGAVLNHARQGWQIRVARRGCARW